MSENRISRPEILAIAGGIIGAAIVLFGIILLTEHGSFEASLVMSPEEIAAANGANLAPRAEPQAVAPAKAPAPAKQESALDQPAAPANLPAGADIEDTAMGTLPPSIENASSAPLVSAPIALRFQASRARLNPWVRPALKAPKLVVAEAPAQPPAKPTAATSVTPSAPTISATNPTQPSSPPPTAAPSAPASTSAAQGISAATQQPIDSAPQAILAPSQPSTLTPQAASSAAPTNIVANGPAADAHSAAGGPAEAAGAPAATSSAAPPLHIVINYQDAAPGGAGTAQELADALRKAGLKNVETRSAAFVVSANQVRYFRDGDQNEAADIRRLITGAKDPQGNPRAFSLSDFSAAASSEPGRIEVWLRSW